MRVSSVLDKREGWVDCFHLDCQKAFDIVLHGRLRSWNTRQEKRGDSFDGQMILMEGNKGHQRSLFQMGGGQLVDCPKVLF